MTLSCSIMAHPKRAAMVVELVGWLDRPVKVVWDEVNDRHDTGLRAVEAFDPSCTHHLVLQDDVVPCRDLLAGTEKALEHVPEGHPVSLYVGKVRPFGKAVNAVVAKASGVSWITMAGIYWGPAVVYPTALIPQMADWFRGSVVQNYDRRMSTWCVANQTRCWYAWPSLVDHRGDESLVRNHRAIRRAHGYVGSDVSALDVDWSRGHVDMVGTERLDRRRQQYAKRR